MCYSTFCLQFSNPRHFVLDDCDFNLNLFAPRIWFEDNDDDDDDDEDDDEDDDDEDEQVKRWIIVCWKPQTSRVFCFVAAKSL